MNQYPLTTPVSRLATALLIGTMLGLAVPAALADMPHGGMYGGQTTRRSPQSTTQNQTQPIGATEEEQTAEPQPVSEQAPQSQPATQPGMTQPGGGMNGGGQWGGQTDGMNNTSPGGGGAQGGGQGGGGTAQ